jgi:nuclear pore complex protein Nup107
MLDVDAPLREGKDIAPEDERADRIIFQYVFELLMNRKYEEAVEVAGNTGNWSLKLALRGWETYIDSEIDARYLEDVDAASRPHGVERKALWRRMCWELAHNARDSYERGVYGFLAGDLDSVLGLCHTWESQFLAYVNHIVNSEAEKPLLDSGRIDRDLADYKLAGADQISSVRKVLDALSRSSDPVVRAESQHPLRIIMGAIINDTVPMLVDSSAADIQAALEGDDDTNVALTSTLLRVLTHLVLFLNQIGVPTGQQKSLAIIVRAYILLLRDSDRSSRVPIYIAYLPKDVAKEVYSDLLAQVTDPVERRKHLQLGRKYHLDMDDIIRATVQQLFKEVAVRQAPPEGFLLVDTDVSSDDIRLCRAVEWHMEAGLWYEAIAAIIGFFRHMLWRGRIGAALAFGKRVDISTVLKKYDASPSNLVSITDERRSEVLEYAKLVAVLKLIDQWSVVLPSLTGHPKKNISEAYQLVQTICDKVYEFSQTWLLDASGSEGDDALTKADCLVARSVYVPYLLLALVDILSEAGTINQGYLRQAVEVSVLVADERYRLYELFVKGGHLDELLRKVAVCATDAVATGEQGLWAL